jgi:hypothetical protein
MIPKVVASEMGKAQTDRACFVGVVGLGDMELQSVWLMEWCGKANHRG